jgi:hypothetical protein
MEVAIEKHGTIYVYLSVDDIFSILL